MHVTPAKIITKNKTTMQKSDGNDPGATTDEQRVVTYEAGDHVTGDVPLFGQVKSRVNPRGSMKAARSVKHRGLPGRGGLCVCIRRSQQLYGPRGMGVCARALRC